jgi:hypothetical protein
LVKTNACFIVFIKNTRKGHVRVLLRLMLLQEIFANDDPADKCVPETQKKTFKMKKNKSDLIMAAAKGACHCFMIRSCFLVCSL